MPRATIRTKSMAAVALILTLLFAGSGAAEEAKKIKAYWSQRNRRADIRYLTKNGTDYISLKSLADFLGAEYSAKLKTGKCVLTTSDRIITFTQYSPYVIAGDKSYNLVHDVVSHGGEFYSPSKSTIELLGRFLNLEFDLDVMKSTLSVYPTNYNVLDLVSQAKINGLLIEIFLSKMLKYEISKTIDSWLIITIHEGKLNPDHFTGGRRSREVLETKAYQFDNSAQLSIRLSAREFNVVDRYKDDPPRIQLSIKANEFSDTILAYSESNLSAETPAPADSLIDVIVIDPGHGGDDEGAVGRSGLLEKDVVLDISKRLAARLRESGFEVVMTRDDDRFVSLADRANIANEAGADLFISIHCNAAENKSARGSIVFFLADAKTDQARAAAALENEVFKFETTANVPNKSDIGFILSDMIQTEHLKESAELAQLIHENLRNVRNLERRGIDQAGFIVLNKAFVPSVLVETAFITNKKDEELLRSDKFREAFAEEIARAVATFKAEFDAR